MPQKETGSCKCPYLEDLAEDPKAPIEFDERLNEFHILRKGGGISMIYYCPFCGGSAPKSRRSLLFHKITDAERRRLFKLTKDINTLDDVKARMGKPNIKQSIGMVITTPERDGKPQRTQGFPMMIYTELSKTADVHVRILPGEKVAIGFQGKSKTEKSTTSDSH